MEYSCSARSQALDRRIAIGPPSHKLRQERVVFDWYRPARVHAGINPDMGSGRFAKLNDLARRGKKLIFGIFGADAALHRPSPPIDIFLPERQPIARGDFQLELNQIVAGDQFGDWMLDLQARIHLQEIEISAASRPETPACLG